MNIKIFQAIRDVCDIDIINQMLNKKLCKIKDLIRKFFHNFKNSNM